MVLIFDINATGKWLIEQCRLFLTGIRTVAI